MRGTGADVWQAVECTTADQTIHDGGTGRSVDGVLTLDCTELLARLGVAWRSLTESCLVQIFFSYFFPGGYDMIRHGFRSAATKWYRAICIRTQSRVKEGYRGRSNVECSVPGSTSLVRWYGENNHVEPFFRGGVSRRLNRKWYSV